MSRFHILNGLVLIGALTVAGIFATSARASTGEEVSIFHFKAPVQLPGRVLPAGSYPFRLAQSTSEMNVVEIKNPQQTRLYGVFLVKPEFEARVPKRSTIIFEKRAPGAPRAIKAWFYQGSKYLNDFIYPR